MAKHTKKQTKLQKLFAKDANGRTNRTGIVLFFGVIFLPIVIFLGIKVGIYAEVSGNHDAGLTILLSGLTTPFATVLNMARTRTFGRTGFDPEYLILLLLIYGAILVMSLVSADMMKNKSSKKDGDMEFGDPEEYNKKFAYPLGKDEVIEPKEPSAKEPGNMIISEHTRYNLSGTAYTYSCALVVGSTGSAKTFRYVKPNIMQMNASFVCTDPKTELIRDCGQMLSNNGYNVLLFNLKKGEQRFSCRYNPFAYIHDEQDVVLTVDAFLEAAQEDKGTGGDPFFPIAEKNFYYALFYYVFTKHKNLNDGTVGTLKEVYELYAKADESEQKPQTRKKSDAERAAIIENEFDRTFLEVSRTDPTNPCLSFYKTFKNGSPKTKQSILISVGIKLWFLSVPETANLLSGDDLHFEKIGERKTALFIAIPTDNKSFRCISAMLFTQLFQELYYQGETLNAKSYLLKKGLCVAARSKQFIDGTRSQEEAKKELERLKVRFEDAKVVYEKDLAKEDAKLNAYLSKPNDLGILPWAKYRVVDGQGKLLETFNTQRAAEEYLDAGKNGEICQVTGLAVRVRFLLDEFYAIGKIGGFEEKIATFRSLNISSDIICQNLEQLKEMYEDHEGKVTGNCDLRICLGVNDMNDAKAFSDMCGQTTVRTQSANIKNNNVISMPEGGSMSDSAEMLIRPEWLLNKMQGDEELILTRTMFPIKDKKYNTPSHPNWGQLFNDHDPEHTMQNKFPFRNIFCIEQKKENLIRTEIPDPMKQARAVEERRGFAPPAPKPSFGDLGWDNSNKDDPKEDDPNQNKNNEHGQKDRHGSNEGRPDPRKNGHDLHKDGQDTNKDKKATTAFQNQTNALHGSDADQKKAEEEARKQQILQQNQNGNVPITTMTPKELSVMKQAMDEKRAILDQKENIIKSETENLLFDFTDGETGSD
jgi:type IV secretory pathway TraG/TraD family ATPase VirD4